MSTIRAFNDMMEQFLEELVQTFPEEKTIKMYHSSFELLRKANGRACLENYMKNIAPYANHVMQKDDAFFLDNPTIIDGLDFKKIWTDDLSAATKNAIWQYLQTLYILGTTISALPEDTMAMIEQMAQKAAREMKPGAIDPGMLMSGMSNMFQQSKPENKSPP
jgi:hypothetical protein